MNANIEILNPKPQNLRLNPKPRSRLWSFKIGPWDAKSWEEEAGDEGRSGGSGFGFRDVKPGGLHD